MTTPLTQRSARVRPIDEPVPRALLGTDLEPLFAGFARMNDGERHRELRDEIDARLANVEMRHIVDAARLAAATLADTPIDSFIEQMPIASVALLLGGPSRGVHEITGAVLALVHALRPHASPESIERGCEATRRLRAWFSTCEIGLLFQTADATRSLIAKTLVSINAGEDTASISGLVERISHDDPAIDHTKRYIGNEAVVVPLVGDSAFGEGPHACPGRAVALAIASIAVEQLLSRSTAHVPQFHPIGYERLHNTCIARFSEPSACVDE